jgi:nicotinate phosphoribosyltransferase
MRSSSKGPKGFFIADEQAIRAGQVTDVYFPRALEVLSREKADAHVTAEVRTTSLPDGYLWAILAGVQELAFLFQGCPVEVDCLDEGTSFWPGEPVAVLRGQYSHFGHLETALLGLLCQASGVATKAARCKKVAGDRVVINFGARRMHPALAPMIDRYAYLGGCDGVAVVKSAQMLGLQPSGTIPHALVLLLGDTVKAAIAFHRAMPSEVPRIVLIDTFADEKFETLRVAEALGEKLSAVRLDTPLSRRGNMLDILREVRWELDLRGFEHVKLFVSGGLDEYEILRLNPGAQGYGVGTAISNAPVINFSLDIVEIQGKPLAKKGKRSGAKRVLRCERCGRREVVPKVAEPKPCSCGGQRDDLLKPLVSSGQIVRHLPQIGKIRDSVIRQLNGLELE